MSIWVAFRPLFLLIFVAVVILFTRDCVAQPIDLPDPPKVLVRTEGCIVGSEEAKVHEKYENARIQFVNDDNSIQTISIDSKLALLFKVRPRSVVCFHEGSIVPVTVVKCEKDQEGECNFNLPHIVYVRTELAEVLNWKYTKPAS